MSLKSSRAASLCPSAISHERSDSGSSGPSPRPPSASPLPADSPVPGGSHITPTGKLADVNTSNTSYQRQMSSTIPSHAMHPDDAPSNLPFQPFFTLVEDSSTQTTAHPSVSYIFADDEHDPIADAALRIQSQSQSHASSQPQRRSSKSSPHERAILINLSPSGRAISSFHSLTPDFHVNAATVTPAPTLDGGDDQTLSGTSPGSIVSRLRRGSAAVADRLRAEEALGLESDDGGPLMLRLQGRGRMEGVDEVEGLRLGLEGLREVFEGKMEELRRVLVAGQEVEKGEDAQVDEAGREID